MMYKTAVPCGCLISVTLKTCPLHPKAKRPGSTWQWRKVRQQVLTRDGGVCHICGGMGANSADHVIPHSEGGTDHPSNLRAAHLSCNSSRGKKPITYKQGTLE